MSAITLLGTPAEVYQFGTMYWLIGASYFIGWYIYIVSFSVHGFGFHSIFAPDFIFIILLVMPATNYLYLPIFYKLQVTSAYEVKQFFAKKNCVINNYPICLNYIITVFGTALS